MISIDHRMKWKNNQRTGGERLGAVLCTLETGQTELEEDSKQQGERIPEGIEKKKEGKSSNNTCSS